MKRRWSKYDTYLVFLVGLLVVPTLLMIMGSFATRWPWPELFPHHPGLKGYCQYFSGVGNMEVLLKSIGLSFIVTLLTLIMALPAAKAMGQMNFKGKRIVNTVIMLPLIVPTVSIAMGIHILFLKTGLANNLLGVIIIQIFPCLPYGIRILQSAFNAMGENLQIQARNLGSSVPKAFFYITLPMLSPALVSAFSMIFIISYSQYLLTLLIGGGRVMTLTTQMIPFLQSGDRLMGSVYSVVFMVTSILVLLGVEKVLSRIYAMDRIYYY